MLGRATRPASRVSKSQTSARRPRIESYVNPCSPHRSRKKYGPKSLVPVRPRWLLAGAGVRNISTVLHSFFVIFTVRAWLGLDKAEV